MRRSFHLAALSVALLVGATTSLNAQDRDRRVILRPHQASATLENGAGWRFDIRPTAFEHEQARVESHRCRSCRGQHHYYRFDQSFAEGPIARIQFDFDVVGNRTNFRSGRGPYPARGEVSIWVRGAEVPQQPRAEVVVEHVRGTQTQSLNVTLTFQNGPLQSLLLVLPPSDG